MKFQVPATISKIVTMADKSLRLQVDTQELTKADKAKVFELHEEIGWFMFSRAEFKEEDVINLPEILHMIYSSEIISSFISLPWYSFCRWRWQTACSPSHVPARRSSNRTSASSFPSPKNITGRAWISWT